MPDTIHRRGYAENPAGGLRALRRGHHRRAQCRRRRRRERRSCGACAHDAQPLGDALDAQGVARRAGRASSRGLARRSGQDALRLRARRTDDRCRDPPRGVDRQQRDPSKRSDAGARDADRRCAEVRSDDLFGEKYGDEVRVLDIGSSRGSFAAARTSRERATSASSRSSRRAASQRAFVASRR